MMQLSPIRATQRREVDTALLRLTAERARLPLIETPRELTFLYLSSRSVFVDYTRPIQGVLCN